MGLDSLFSLTPRELDLIKWIAHGYPASYIAHQLQLSIKTIENYTATIKCKLNCKSKIELINKALEITSTGYFN
jgi:DNA-binding NarL/FixJ family response regulator